MPHPEDMNGVFAIHKPTGVTSAQFLARLQQLFTSSSVFSQDLARLRGAKVEQLQKEGQKASRRKLRKVMKVKMGHGGTLDPLATGVLVVGVGKGTKMLQNYLSGSVKTYEAEALFGASTTTGDVEGEILTRSGTSHITKEDVMDLKEKFTGNIKQTPPIFAALKMNGKPLYEYAREGLPLPKPLDPREVEIYEIQIFDDSLSKNHHYEFIRSVDIDGTNLEEKLADNPTLNDSRLYFSKQYAERNSITEDAFEDKPYPATADEKAVEFKAPLLHFTAKVSSGTYIRSLISDMGRALRSNAYMVKLERTQQAEWVLGKNVFTIEDFEDRPEGVWGNVLSEVLSKGGNEIEDINSLFKRAQDEHIKVEEEKKDNLRIAESAESDVADLPEVVTDSSTKKRVASEPLES